ncbi:protocadherin gamma-B1-like [Dendropsophus ebraccatus]|uniref:protocadherin gamma-B1-like n=1 Tax=Dendropsophus ebraccatus TaxID=150705 RepID=UPI003831BC7B
MDEKNGNGGKRTMKWQVSFFIISFISDLICAQLHYSIPEEMKQGSTVGNIAKDLGLTINELSFRKFHVVSRGKAQYFNVNLESGDLYVAERIDRERICDLKQSCLISFEAVIENPLHLYSIKVEIQDVNDNSPSFSKNTFDVVISESALPGVHLALGHAHDLDIGTNSVQDYNINNNEYFSLGIKTTKDGIKFPELILEKNIDRERQSTYELILTALDGGQPPNTGTAFIKIKVHDVNDNFPKFSKDTFEVSVNENVPVGFLVLQLNAVDEDEGLNAQITYSFRDIPEIIYSVFSIDPENGKITVIGNIDYELRERYELTIEAKDGGGLETHCKILIHIIDINDNAPEVTITSLQDRIPEDCPPDTIIALINVHDLDSEQNGEVICEISEDLPFQLISSSTNYYKLVTRTYVDRETRPFYNITIRAMDNGSPQLSSNNTIQLTISDVNDNIPIFEKNNYVVYVQENNIHGMSIHSIHASDYDIDENAKLIYSVLSNTVDNIPVTPYVSINSMTGVLYAQRSLDYEQLREFQFQVMAKDSGSPPLSSNVTVRICIIDKNDNAPKILYPSADTEGSALFEFIPHSAEKGYLVTKVIAVDADSGHNAWLSYHLIQVQEPSLFTIGQYTGEIRIGRDLPDIESLRQKVVVLVKDNGVPSLSSTVTLSFVVAESFQQVVPEVKPKQSNSDSASNLTFYLLVCIALISLFFIVTIIVTTFYKCRKSRTPPTFGPYSRNVYPQFTLGCPSEISDTSLPFPFSYDVCVTLDSKQNEIAYLKPVQNVPTDNLIDTEDSTRENNSQKDSLLPICNLLTVRQF